MLKVFGDIDSRKLKEYFIKWFDRKREIRAAAQIQCAARIYSARAHVIRWKRQKHKNDMKKLKFFEHLQMGRAGRLIGDYFFHWYRFTVQDEAAAVIGRQGRKWLDLMHSRRFAAATFTYAILAWRSTLIRRRNHESSSIIIGRAWRTRMAKKRLSAMIRNKLRYDEYIEYCRHRSLHNCKKYFYKMWIKSKQLSNHHSIIIQSWWRCIFSKIILKRMKLVHKMLKRNEKYAILKYKNRILRKTFLALECYAVDRSIKRILGIPIDDKEDEEEIENKNDELSSSHRIKSHKMKSHNKSWLEIEKEKEQIERENFLTYQQNELMKKKQKEKKKSELFLLSDLIDQFESKDLDPSDVIKNIENKTQQCHKYVEEKEEVTQKQNVNFKFSHLPKLSNDTNKKRNSKIMKEGGEQHQPLLLPEIGFGDSVINNHDLNNHHLRQEEEELLDYDCIEGHEALLQLNLVENGQFHGSSSNYHFYLSQIKSTQSFVWKPTSASSYLNKSKPTNQVLQKSSSALTSTSTSGILSNLESQALAYEANVLMVESPTLFILKSLTKLLSNKINKLQESHGIGNKNKNMEHSSSKVQKVNDEKKKRTSHFISTASATPLPLPNQHYKMHSSHSYQKMSSPMSPTDKPQTLKLVITGPISRPTPNIPSNNNDNDNEYLFETKRVLSDLCDVLQEGINKGLLQKLSISNIILNKLNSIKLVHAFQNQSSNEHEQHQFKNENDMMLSTINDKSQEIIISYSPTSLSPSKEMATSLRKTTYPLSTPGNIILTTLELKKIGALPSAVMSIISSLSLIQSEQDKEVKIPKKRPDWLETKKFDNNNNNNNDDDDDPQNMNEEERAHQNYTISPSIQSSKMAHIQTLILDDSRIGDLASAALPIAYLLSSSSPSSSSSGYHSSSSTLRLLSLCRCGIGFNFMSVISKALQGENMLEEDKSYSHNNNNNNNHNHIIERREEEGEEAGDRNEVWLAHNKKNKSKNHNINNQYEHFNNVKQKSKLETLLLSGNIYISDATIDQLCLALVKGNKNSSAFSLQHLDLSFCSITNHGARSISKCLDVKLNQFISFQIHDQSNDKVKTKREPSKIIEFNNLVSINLRGNKQIRDYGTISLFKSLRKRLVFKEHFIQTKKNSRKKNINKKKKSNPNKKEKNKKNSYLNNIDVNNNSNIEKEEEEEEEKEELLSPFSKQTMESLYRFDQNQINYLCQNEKHKTKSLKLKNSEDNNKEEEDDDEDVWSSQYLIQKFQNQMFQSKLEENQRKLKDSLYESGRSFDSSTFDSSHIYDDDDNDKALMCYQEDMLTHHQYNRDDNDDIWFEILSMPDHFRSMISRKIGQNRWKYVLSNQQKLSLLLKEKNNSYKDDNIRQKQGEKGEGYELSPIISTASSSTPLYSKQKDTEKSRRSGDVNRTKVKKSNYDNESDSVSEDSEDSYKEEDRHDHFFDSDDMECDDLIPLLSIDLDECSLSQSCSYQYSLVELSQNLLKATVEISTSSSFNNKSKSSSSLSLVYPLPTTSPSSEKRRSGKDRGKNQNKTSFQFQKKSAVLSPQRLKNMTSPT